MQTNGHVVSENLDEEKESKSSKSVFKISSGLFLARFIIEFIVVAGVSALAYFLRFDETQIFESFLPLIPCGIFTSIPKVNPQPNYYVEDVVFVSVLFATPLGAMLIGEIVHWILWRDVRKVILIGHFRVEQIVRRLIRFTGCFYFGFLLVSIVTDMLGYLISRPSPNFFNSCMDTEELISICATNPWINVSQCMLPANGTTYTEFFRSFPNYRSATSAYAATFMAWYFHTLLESLGSYILCPMIAVGWSSLSLMASLSDLAVQKAHWEDVAVGLALGIVMAIYIVSVLHFFREPTSIKYRSKEDLNEKRVSSTGKTIVESVPDELLSEADLHSPPQYLPRVQAVNTGFQSTLDSSRKSDYYESTLRRAPPNNHVDGRPDSRGTLQYPGTQRSLMRPIHEPPRFVHNGPGYQQQTIMAYSPRP